MEEEKIKEMYMSFRIYNKALQKEIKKYMSEYNLSPQHANYLIALHNREGLSVKELNEMVDNDGAATARIIKKLAESDMTSYNYINYKSYTVNLTNKGKYVAKGLLAILSKLKKYIIKPFNSSEL